MTTATFNNPDTVVGIRGLRKRRGTFTLHDLNLDIPRGYVLGLAGTNASGKTTIINSITGALIPDAGNIRAPTSERIGVVLDTPFYPQHWTAENIEHASAPFYPTWSPQRYRDLLHRLRVPLHTKIKNLSRGQSMKLQAAAALAHNPELLILDEPTAGLDPLTRDDLLDLVAEYMENPNHSTLYSSHITTDLERISDHLLLLHQGRAIYHGPTLDLLENYRLIRGNLHDLNHPNRRHLYGLRVHAAGFEAHAPTHVVNTWPRPSWSNAPPSTPSLSPSLKDTLPQLQETSHE
ncbi:Nickel import ATP-binding protein NikO [Dermatophilus congolensis]|uniref:Nickel import ATP-binding protein NikO n=1 Tax=Dermatophilus congolensis TaxID=1863 RepID=A0AA46H028_9MICO|nr:ABC transporter ATP-binding protein [Dermatophilus congolensis]STD07206.1 Nickel import ATP-binding protein NikO [Dermatophilus congolensis]